MHAFKKFTFPRNEVILDKKDEILTFAMPPLPRQRISITMFRKFTISNLKKAVIFSLNATLHLRVSRCFQFCISFANFSALLAENGFLKLSPQISSNLYCTYLILCFFASFHFYIFLSESLRCLSLSNISHHSCTIYEACQMHSCKPYLRDCKMHFGQKPKSNY